MGVWSQWHPVPCPARHWRAWPAFVGTLSLGGGEFGVEGWGSHGVPATRLWHCNASRTLHRQSLCERCQCVGARKWRVLAILEEYRKKNHSRRKTPFCVHGDISEGRKKMKIRTMPPPPSQFAGTCAITLPANKRPQRPPFRRQRKNLPLSPHPAVAGGTEMGWCRWHREVSAWWPPQLVVGRVVDRVVGRI